MLYDSQLETSIVLLTASIGNQLDNTV
jgi:hypothetical protein